MEIPCDLCDELFSKQSFLERHKETIHKYSTASSKRKREGDLVFPIKTLDGITRHLCMKDLRNERLTIRFLPHIDYTPVYFFKVAAPIVQDTLRTLSQYNSKTFATLAVLHFPDRNGYQPYEKYSTGHCMDYMQIQLELNDLIKFRKVDCVRFMDFHVSSEMRNDLNTLIKSFSNFYIESEQG